MKHSLIRYYCAVVLGFCLPMWISAAPLKDAKVTQVINEVNLLLGQSATKRATVNDDVHEGTAVRTGVESRSELTFTDQTLARLGANTIFTFNEGTRSMELGGGAMLLRVPKNAGGAKITTAAVTAAITGTTVMMQFDPDGYAKFIVLEGTACMFLRSKPNDCVQVRAGQLLTVKVKPAPSSLPAPVSVDVKKLMDTSALLSADFAPLPSLDLIAPVVEEQKEQKAEAGVAENNSTSSQTVLASLTDLNTAVDQRTSVEEQTSPTPSPTPVPVTPTPTPSTPTPTPSTPTPTPSTPTPSPSTPTPTPSTPTPTPPPTPTPTPPPGTQTITYNSSENGRWSDPAVWTPGVVPNNDQNGNTYSAVISGGFLAQDIAPGVVIEELFMTGGTLRLDNPLTLNSGLNYSGGAINSGLLFLAGLSKQSARMSVIGLTINNNGDYAVVFDGDIFNGGSSVFNNGGTLRKINGTGTANFNIPLNNTGTVSVETGTLRLALSGTLASTYSISGGAALLLASDSSVANGTLFTGAGTVQIDNSRTVTLNGTVTNNATILFSNTGNGIDLRLNGNVTLAGTGTTTLNNFGNNRIFANTGGDRFTIGQGQTVQGSGNIGVGQTTITNNGTIRATQSVALTLQPGGGSADLLNGITGILEANGGTLQLSGASGGVFTNTGIIRALNNSVVQLVSNAQVVGGALATTGSEIHNTGSNGLTNVTNNGTFVLDNASTLTLTGTITNNGTFTFGNTGNGVDLRLNGNVTLGGTGTTMLNNFGNNRIFANTAGDRLTIGQGQTIQGSGNIGIGQTTITNNGTIRANQSTALTLQPGGGNADFLNGNTGVLEAANGGVLQFSGASGGIFTNTGTIRALNGSVIQLVSNAQVVGGALATTGSEIHNTGSNGLTNVNNNGNFILDNASTLTLTGTITNNGTLTFANTGNGVDLRLNGNVTLGGTGTTTLNNFSNNRIFANTAGNRLTIGQGQTIQGSGNIGVGQTTITNNGTIRANQSIALTLQPGGGGADFLNGATGILEANGGTLQLSGASGGVFTNTGIIRALNNSVIQLVSNAQVVGGALATTGSEIHNTGSNGLTDVTNNGNFILDNASTLTLTGTITNNGTFTLGNTGNGVDLRLNGNVMLAGTGTISLNNFINNRIFANTAGDRLTIGAGLTIQGAGNIGVGQTTFTNNGVISATLGNALVLQPGGGVADFINAANGVLQANGGTLQLSGASGGTFLNNGIIQALGGSQVQLVSNARVVGGTLASPGSAIHNVGSNSLTGLTNNGNLVLDNSSTLTLAGTITNNGTIDFANSGNGVDLRLAGNVTLDGTGTTSLNDFSNNRIFANISGNRLTIGLGQKIQGSGNIGVGQTTFTNDGTITANQSIALILQPGGGSADFTNSATGVLQANGVGALELSGASGGSFGNSGMIESISGGTLRFNGTVASSGVVNVRDGTLTATGSYTQTGGSFLLAGGSVQSNNTLNFQGGLIDARGIINAAISNNAMLRPALGGSGLQVTGNVSLLSASSLVFQIGGLTQGSQYGFLNVTGNVSLGGQLVLSFVNGFNNPSTGQTFTLMNTTALSGAFANIASGNRLTTSGSEGSFLVNYSGTTLTLSNFIPGTGPNVVAANWLGAASGSWITPANWSSNPNYPNNGTPSNTVYNAAIAATGAPYTVTLANPVTVQSFTLNSNDAILSLNSGAVLTTVNTSVVSAGTLLMNAGTLRGGTVNLSGSGALVFTDNLNTLDGVLLNGGFTLGPNHLARLRNGAQINGVVTLSGTNAILALDQSGVLNTSLTVNLDAASAPRLSVEGNSTPTLGANVLVRGGGTIGQQLLTGGTNGLTNQGTITADRAALALTIQPDSFTNQGTLNATSGATLNLNATNWQSTGTINVTNSTANFGGTFTNLGAGTINSTNSTLNLTGTFNNAGGNYTLPVSATAFTMAGGRILGGTVNIAPGGASLLFNNSGSNRLDGVTVNGNFTLGASQIARLQNGAQINGVVTQSGNSSILALDESSTLNTALTINMDSVGANGDVTVEGNNTPTLGSNVLIRGAGFIGRQLLVGGTSSLTNQGTITADRSGLALDIRPDSFTNQGTLNATGGAILNLSATNWQNSGTINATNSIVNFGGTFTNLGLGTINSTNSTLNITGTFNNTGANYTLPNSAVAFTLSGGRILGGTLNIAPSGASLLFTTSGSNRLDGVAVNGNFSLGASQIARLQNGAQINGVVTQSGNSSILALDESSALNTALTVNMDSAGANSDVSVEGNNNPTLGANVLIRGAGFIGRQLLAGGTNSLTNQGTITADRNGVALDIRPGSFTNQGTLNAIGGAILSLNATNWQSTGTINATNSIVNFGGTFTNLGLGTINSSNSTLNITGTFNNTGATYTLPNSAVTFTLSGGRILGGTLNIAPTGASLLFTTSGSNRLDNVAINGNFTLGASQIARLQNGAQINGVVTESGNSGILALDQSTVLNTTLTVNMDSPGANSDVSVEGNNTPTLGSNVLIRGAGFIGRQLLVGGTNSLTNQGAITADRNGLALDIRPDTFNNQGTLNATGGGILSLNATNWQSTGTINATNSIVNFGGTFLSTALGTINNTNSTLNITGTLNNTGNTYTLPTSASAFTLAGGRILGGTLNIAATGAQLLFTTNGSNRLDGVAVNGNFTLGASQIARLQNGAQIIGVVTQSGNSSILAVDESAILNTALTVNMDSPGANSDISIEGNNSAAFGANVVVRGAGFIGRQLLVGGTNSLTNQGTISADRAGQTLSVRPQSFTNQGTAKAINGGLLSFSGTTYTQTAGSLQVTGSTISSSSVLQIQGGLLSGFGTISAPISNNAMLRPELGGTGLNVNGAVSLLSASNLVFQLGGLTQGSQYGYLNVNGSAALGGNLVLSFVNNFQNTVANNNSFTVLSSTAALTGVFANVASGSRLTTTDASGSFLVTYTGNNLVLSDYSTGGLRPGSVQTPVPDTQASVTPSRDDAALDSVDGVRIVGAPRPGTVAFAGSPRVRPLTKVQPAAVAINLESSNQLQDLLDGAELTQEKGKVRITAKRAAKFAGARANKTGENAAPQAKLGPAKANRDRSGGPGSERRESIWAMPAGRAAD